MRNGLRLNAALPLLLAVLGILQTAISVWSGAHQLRSFNLFFALLPILVRGDFAAT